MYGWVLAALLFLASADVYFHAPRGANDRCDEKSNNRNNDQRCWDSENNAAGGYSICEGEMQFYTDTVLRIEWYSQHNCGNGAKTKTDPLNPELVFCAHVLQLGCEEDFRAFAGDEAPTYKLTDGISLGRPGADAANVVDDNNGRSIYDTFGDTCTQTKPTTATCDEGTHNDASCANLNLADGGSRGTFNGAQCSCSPRKMQTYCYHEPEAFWLKCKARDRNKGLFTATQNVNNDNGALRTRQEPNSQRYGFECVEERDYWPYWHPSPWRDLAVLTSDTSLCKFFQSESQNVKDKCECVCADSTCTADDKSTAMKANQEISCTGTGNTKNQWKCTGNSFNWKAPDCILSNAQSDNMLGRIDTRGDNSEHSDGSRMAYYDWKIPESIIPKGKDSTRCLIRIRYNISNAEVLQDFDSKDNKKISQNPVHTVGEGNSTKPVNETIPLRMAINTAQFGRTFEDRTYIFTIKQRPSELKGKTIHNLNVRGKRGNIAQVRNCVEYDFLPIYLKADVGDKVHFQWCLSDYNDNGNAGEGRAGTDRVNVISIGTFNANVVQALNKTTTSIFSDDDLKALAWLNQDPANCYSTSDSLGSKSNAGNDPKSCHFLNGVRNPTTGLPTGYFSYIATVIRGGVFQYISSRNNNFTNRSQKAQITVGTVNLSSGAIAGIVIGSVVGVAAIAGIAFLVYKKGGLSFSFSNKV